MPENLENSAVVTGLEKVRFHSSSKERQCQTKTMPMSVQTTTQTALISHASKVYAQNSPSKASTVCELETSWCSTWILKRQRNQRSNYQHALDHRKSKRIPEKNIYFCFTDYAKAFVWITTNCGKFLKTWEYQTILPTSWETCIQVKKQQLKLEWNNRLVTFWERSMSRLYIVTLHI